MEEAHRLVSSRKAYRSHVTRLLRKVEEITQNKTVPMIEEPYLTTLITSVEQLESKSSILQELDTKIAEHTTNPDELENEIFKAVEIQDSISESTCMAKRIISRSAHPQPLSCTEPPLNVDAIPYQPAQTNTISPIVEEHEETHVNNAEAILTGSHRESTLLEHENTP